MTPAERRGLVRRASEVPAPLTLVVASLVSAVAAIAELTVWVSSTAAVAAFVSGLVVIRSEILAPVRVRSATNACVRVTARVSRADSEVEVGSATQFLPGRWLTAAHVVTELSDFDRDGCADAEIREVFLAIGAMHAPAQVVFCDARTNVAVLTCTTSHPWTAHLASPAELADLHEGVGVRIVGWTPTNGAPPMRIFYDQVTQTLLERGWLFLTGQQPLPGMAGGPAIKLDSGRVVGIVCAAQVATDHRGLVGGYVATLGAVPSEHLRASPGHSSGQP